MTQRPVAAWLAVIGWIVLIYTTIPFVRQLREAFVARWPAKAIGIGVMLVVAAATVVAIASLRHRRRPLVDVLWLTAVAGVTVLWTQDLMGQPEEAVHFLEYGVLGLLLYRALRLHVPDATVFLAAALAGIIVGTVDEIIQWIVPGRYFDFRDIAINSGASVLVQIVVWRMVPQRLSPVRRESLQLLCRLAAVWILLLIFCVSATPTRLSRGAPYLPGLSATDDALCEYGHLHWVDAKTWFRSRLSLEDLASSDGTRAREVAAILDGSRGAYREFLLSYPSTVDAFAYEARVHIFARDQNLSKARKTTTDPAERGQRVTAAFRENFILESFFPKTIGESSFAWNASEREQIEAAQDPGVVFTSRVGAHLITRITESQLRGLLLAALAILVVCDLSIRRRSRSLPRSG